MHLVLSRQIRYLAGRDELMLYHEGTGAALMLTEGARRALHRAAGILEAWRVPGPRGRRTDEEKGRESLVAWRFLVPERDDDREALLGWYPLRSPWSAFYANPDGSVVLARTDRETGGPALEVLPPPLAYFWRACDGRQPLRDILAEAGDAVAPRLRSVLETWTRWDQQLLKWLPQPVDRYGAAGLPGPVLSHGKHLADLGTRPPTDAVGIDAEATARELAEYHAEGIRDASEQFDERETTLSHLYRVPHPCLAGLRYGARVAEVLGERGLLDPEVRQIVEVGAGTGEVAAAFLEALRGGVAPASPAHRYTIVDLSPALIAGQRETLRGRLGDETTRRVRWTRGDAQRLPLADASVDLLLSNEVIADLPVGDPDGEGLRSTGAVRFVEEIFRVLRPGGGAFLTEYGELEATVRVAHGLDHPEFVIRYRDLIARAETLGLEASLHPVGDLLDFDTEQPVLAADGALLAELDAIARAAGGTLPVLCYTPELLQRQLAGVLDPRRLHTLHYVVLGVLPHVGLCPNVFKALLLRKPGGREA